MSLFDDILKGLPVNPLLREKITELEAKYAATETENSILKDDLREAKAESQKLKKQIEELTHSDDLDEVELKLLLLIANLPYDDAVKARLAPEFPAISRARLDYHIKGIEDLRYIRGGIMDQFGTHYAPTQEGRTLLLKKSLL